ncbi:hypothetical protein [uncultured Cellulomonas sp.]|uniref:hypothetical protein n=1 Tax=uncultured Cellulomonas sp. TaxID=189682 RepID=UPI0028E9D3AC|nr:hypothetical protein [uncultured Cellulomonas sp.]
MTSAEGAPVRRSRRAVRHAGTVGTDDAVLVSTHPALPTSPAPTAAPEPSVTAAEPVVATRSADDTDVGWGEAEGGSNDDRLSRDKPPHW